MTRKNSLIVMIAMIFNGLIGSAVYFLPQNVSAHAYGKSVLIGWLILGVGMLSLSILYAQLAVKRPDFDAGPYSYAKHGFGPLTGFLVGWSYWTATLLLNATLLTILLSELSIYVPFLGHGGNFMSLLVESIILWSIFYVIIRNQIVNQMNVVFSCIKIIPILVFIGVCLQYFDLDVFDKNMYPVGAGQSVGTMGQVKTMVVSVMWGFIGIEGASIFSKYAMDRKDIRNATFLGFGIVYVLYVLISVLPIGVLSHDVLATATAPSTQFILEKFAGSWSHEFIGIGMIISVFGALLVWMQYVYVIPRTAAKDGLFPTIFKSITKCQDQKWKSSEFISTFLIQILLIVAYFMSSTYTILIELSTSGFFIPYLVSALYFLTYVLKRNLKYKVFYLIFALTSVAFTSWLLYIAGLKYVFLVAIIYTIGLPIYIKWTNNPLSKAEKICAMCCVVLSTFGIYNIALVI